MITAERLALKARRPPGREEAFDPKMWAKRAEGYDGLGWVNAAEPLEMMVGAANLKPGERLVDVGTGSQKVLDAFKPHDGLFGFDISSEMLALGKNGNRLFSADAERIPFGGEAVDVVTARMVFHHLPRADRAVGEIGRILRPGGRMVVMEYVVPDDEVRNFERGVFELKEPGRHLWTGSELARLVASNWRGGVGAVRTQEALMPQYSVKDWMGKSGLPQETQEAVLSRYLQAPRRIVQKMNISYRGSDALVDRPFALVVATK
jgi:SAM-dependent methyltransferase